MKRFISFELAALLLCAVCTPVWADSSVKVNLSDSDTVAGDFRFSASGGDALSFAVDGKALKTELGKYRFGFSSNGLEYSGGAIYCGNTALADLPASAGDHELEFDQSALTENDVTITYVPASSEFRYGGGSVYGTYNLDDQIVSKVTMTLPNGEKVSPDSVIYHHPVIDSDDVTNTVDTYSATESYSIGDGWYAETNLGGNTPEMPIYISFVFSDLGSLRESSVGYVADLDTASLADGAHTLEVLSNGKVLRKLSFSTDNTPPEITLDLAFGTALYSDSTLSFSASDPAGECKLYGDIDGERCFPGRDLRYLTVGKHLLTVTATDPLGNVSVTCAEFRLCEKSDFSGEGMDSQTAEPSVSGNVSEYVYQIGDADKFTFVYQGATNENGRILIELYDYIEGKYTDYGIAESDIKAAFEVTDARYIENGEVRVRVSPHLYHSASDTVVWVTDTQYYSNYEDLNHVYELLLNYSVDLFQSNKAGYLIHTGDIVDTHYDAQKAAEEWKFASEVHRILEDAGMPNGVLAGNHDTGNVPPDLTNYKKYFGHRRYADNVWYGGQLNNNACHYDLLTIAGVDYLFLYLSNGVEADAQTVAWANAVCKAYPDRTVILLTHAYLGVNGSYISNPADPTAYNHSRAKEIADLIIAPNPNIAAVLCGHEHGAKRVQREFGEGRYVWEILSDYQYAEIGKEPMHELNGETLDGEGYLRLITFGENGAMHQTTYSPLHDDYNFFADDADTFEVTLQVQSGNTTLRTTEAAVYFEKATVPTVAPAEDPRGIPVWVWIVAAVALLSVAAVAVLANTRKRR